MRLQNAKILLKSTIIGVATLLLLVGFSTSIFADDETAPDVFEDFYRYTWQTYEDTHIWVLEATDEEIISSVEWKLGEGSWNACAAEDGSFDSNSEFVYCTVTGLAEGNQTTYFRATDASENQTTPGDEYELDIFRNSAPEDGLIFADELYDPSDVYDSTGYSSTGKLSSVSEGDYEIDESGAVGSAITFSNNAYIEYSDINKLFDFHEENSKFMVEAYVKAADFEAGDTKIVITKTDDSNNELWFLGVDSAGGIICGVYTDGYQFFETGLLESPILLEDGAWNRIACSYDSEDGTIRAFLDGEQVHSSVSGGSWVIPESDNPIFINGYPPTEDVGFNGGIDEVKIYNFAEPEDDPPDDPSVTLTLASDSQYLSSVGNFSFAGSAEANVNAIEMVQWRPLVTGQGAEEGWQDCSAADGTFDELTESYTCSIASGSTDGTFYFDIRAKDNIDTLSSTKITSALLDSAQIVDIWLNMDNITDGGKHDGVGRTFGATTAHGTPILSTGENGNGAVEFDGQNSVRFHVEDPNTVFDHADDDGNMTLTMKVYPDSAMSGDYRTLIEKSNDGNENHSAWDLVITPEGTAAVRIYLASEMLTFGSADLLTFNYDEWNDITVWIDFANRAVSMKLNDNAVHTETWLLSDDIRESTGGLNIGGHYDGGSSMVGIIDDIIISREGDATPPELTISSLPTSDRVTDSTPSFNLTFEDDGGVISAEYFFSNADTDVPGGNLDSQNWINIAEPTDGEWGGTSETATITSDPLPDGTWTIFVRATNTNGIVSAYRRGDEQNWTNFNEPSAYAMPYYIFVTETNDTTAPQIYSNPVLPNPTIDLQPAIRGYVKDYTHLGQGDTISNIFSISYSIDGGDFIPLDEPVDGTFNLPMEDFYIQISEELAVGDHTIQIRAEDVIGNNTSANDVGTLNGDEFLEFTITADGIETEEESVVKNITFDDHDLHDTIFSDAVWGNGIIRLRQEIDFSSEIAYVPDTPYEFGYPYGEISTSIYPSVDGNLWISTNDGGFIYYNINTDTGIKYEPLRGSTRVFPFEFEHDGDRYLLLNYDGGISSVIYDINNTPENVGDDPAWVNYEDDDTFNGAESFSAIHTDTRDDGIALYGVRDGGGIIRVDLANTPMDLTDDSYTEWAGAEGIGVSDEDVFDGGFTGFVFDQENNMFVAASYSQGHFVVYDNGTPTNKADDVVGQPHGFNTATAIFSVVKDDNGYFWLGGDGGLYRTDINSTATQADDDFVQVLDGSDIGGEAIAKIQWIEGETPVGDEIWMTTRSGRIRALEYNFTYDDEIDDTLYSYKIPQFEARPGGATTFILTDRNSVWNAVAGLGVVKTTLTRSFEDSNTIEIYPTPPSGLLEVDQVLLSSVLGSVSAGSSFSFNDLVTFEISNDAGITWEPISVGSTINFNSSDYKLKLRITLSAGSTPIIDSLQLSYVAQPKGTLVIVDEEDEEEVIIANSGSSSGSTGGSTSACSADAPSGKAPWLYGAIPQSETSVLLYFAGGDGPVDRYVLEYGTKSGNALWGSTYIGDGNSRTYLVEALSPNTTYFFRVRGGNGCATGSWSNEISGTTSTTFTAQDRLISLIEQSENMIAPEFPDEIESDRTVGAPPFTTSDERGGGTQIEVDPEVLGTFFSLRNGGIAIIVLLLFLLLLRLLGSRQKTRLKLQEVPGEKNFFRSNRD